MAMVRGLRSMGSGRHRKPPASFAAARPASLSRRHGLLRRRPLLPEAEKIRSQKNLSLTQHSRHGLADISRRLHHMNPRSRHRLHLLLGRTLAARDDRTRVTHSPSRRRRLPGDKAHHRLLHIVLDELRRLLLSRPADLADHDDRLGLRIVIQQPQRIDVVRPDNRVAANANRRRLPNPTRRQLIHSLIRQRARPRNNPDRAFLVNSSRHNPDLRLTRRDHSRAVRPDQPRFRALHDLPRLHHIEHRNALRDADHQRYLRSRSLQNSIRGKRRRNEDHRRIRSRLLHRLFHGIEDRPALMDRATLTRRHTADNPRPILRATLGVERTLTARNPLNDEPRILINQNCHYLPPFAAATARSAASFIVLPTWKFNPESFKISRPSSTFVP